MGPTNPAEEHFRRGLWGWATSAWVKLVATAGGILKVHVAEQTGFLTVRQTVASYLVTSGYGWTGAAWRKLPMLWGYSESWRQQVTSPASGSGDANAATTPVAAGYVYILQAVSASHDAVGNKDIETYVYDGSVVAALIPRAMMAPGIAQGWSGKVVLEEGDTVNAYLWAPGDGKAIDLRVWGYKMKVAEA